MDQQKKKKNLRPIFILYITISLVALIYFLFPIVSAQIETIRDKNLRDKAWDLTQTTEHAADPSPLPTAVPTPTPVANDDEPLEPTPTPEPIYIPPSPITGIDIESLRAEFNNDQIIGYLMIENTNIFYPVVQSDDNEYYLERDLLRRKSSAGSIFMDFENHTDNFDKNTVIYGHNMRNGSMFHNIRFFLDEEFFREHRYIFLKTLYEDTVWEIFAFYQTTTDFCYIQTTFTERNPFSLLLKQISEKNFYETDIEVDENDCILTLSTCAIESGNNRYALHAKLLRQP